MWRHQQRTTAVWDAIRQKSLTWTKKLSVVSLIYSARNQKQKINEETKTNTRQCPSRYRFKMSEDSPEEMVLHDNCDGLAARYDWVASKSESYEVLLRYHKGRYTRPVYVQPVRTCRVSTVQAFRKTPPVSISSGLSSLICCLYVFHCVCVCECVCAWLCVRVLLSMGHVPDNKLIGLTPLEMLILRICASFFRI